MFFARPIKDLPEAEKRLKAWFSGNGYNDISITCNGLLGQEDDKYYDFNVANPNAVAKVHLSGKIHVYIPAL